MAHRPDRQIERWTDRQKRKSRRRERGSKIYTYVSILDVEMMEY